jgi:integrase
MLKERKRDGWFHIEGRFGGVRIRLALDTKNREMGHLTVMDIEAALRDGGDSDRWPRLRQVLPEKTFARLADIAGYVEKPVPPSLPTWSELKQLFEADAKRRIALGRFAASTLQRYQGEIREFEVFLSENGICVLAEINRPLVERYKVWRMARIRSRSNLGAAKSLPLCAAILHRVFSFAVENDLLLKNPVRLEGKPGEHPERGAQPIKPSEMLKLREHAGPDLLAFQLLRWSALRGSDAVGLTWGEVDWDAREIVRVTQKRGKRVVIPIHTELFFALEVERDRRKPEPWERVLLNPATGKPLTRPRLYERMLALGRRAGVVNPHPHRFRDSLAIYMLCNGATPYDVAKILGDTIDTVEKHYAPFVPELRDRVRRIIESGSSVEKEGTIWAQSNPKLPQVQ